MNGCLIVSLGYICELYKTSIFMKLKPLFSIQPALKLGVIILLLSAFAKPANAQKADDIINKYVAAMGGKDAWSKVTGLRMTAKVDAQGMTIPLDMISLSDGRSYTSFEFQGKNIAQDVFDGETLWGMNFMTMKAEKSDAEATENKKREAKDFPNEIIGYADRGYKADYVGKETAEGVKCFKIKITKKTTLVDGKEEENVTYHYFDDETYALIMSESTIRMGEAKGQIAQTVYSDYQEVNGVYFPFSILSRLKDGQGQGVVIEKIEVNPKVEDALFKFPVTE
jgi:hypothetical protein